MQQENDMDRRIGELFSEGLTLQEIAEKTGCGVARILERQSSPAAQQAYRSRL